MLRFLKTSTRAALLTAYDVECLKNALKADSTTIKMQRDYVDTFLDRIGERIADLAKRSQ